MTADDAAGATILLVEDDDATRTFLADNLTADGFELLVADCARDARRLLETKYPDLVVLDVGLPDGSGLDLLRAIREADGVASRIDPRVAVLVLSGRAGELDRLRGFDRGCDDYVAKPFSYPELRGRVGRSCGASTAAGPAAACASATSPSTCRAGASRVRGDRRRALPEGVRAAADAGRRADAGLHEAGAAAVDLGPAEHRDDADAGLARLPAAAQARRPRRPLRGQRLGRRLPPRRRPGGGLSPMGVVLAADVVLALAAVVLLRVARRRRGALAARAAHELRGPLTAAAMALHAARRGADDATRAPALDAVARQLGRAGARRRRPRARRRRARAGPAPGARGPPRRCSPTRPPPGGPRPARPGGRSSSPAAPRLVLHADGHLLARALGEPPRQRGRARRRGHHAGRAAPGRPPAPRGPRRGRDGRRRGDGREPAPARPRHPGRRARIVPAGRAAGRGLAARRPRRRPAPRGHGLRVAADAAARHGGRLLVVRDGGGTRRDPRAAAAAAGPHRRSGASPPAPPGAAAAGARAADAGVSPRRRAVLLGGLALTLGALAASDVAGREAALRRDLGPPVAVVVARRELRAGRQDRGPGPRRPAPAGPLRPGGRGRRPASRSRACGRPPTSRPAPTSTPPCSATGRPRRRPARPCGPGERLAQLDVSGAADGVGPGARVDVLVTRDGRGDAAGRTVLALEDVEVVARGAAPAGAPRRRRPGARRRPCA